MYREQGGVIVDRSNNPLEHWDKYRFPLGWEKFTPAVFKVAIDEANRVWDDNHNEEEAEKAGMELAQRYATEHNVKLYDV